MRRGRVKCLESVTAAGMGAKRMGWVEESVFYHIYPLGFCGAPMENKSGTAKNRLQKLESWIPHLKGMGVNALYLGPVFESEAHGYDTRDYRVIDRRLGTNAMLKKLVQKLHENGIRVVLDGVFNHVGRSFWAFRDVLENGEGSRYCGWFANLRFGGQSPYGDRFIYEGWQGHYNLVKLNLKNQEVVAHLLEAVGMWMDEFGIDGLRLDAADCVDIGFFQQLRGYCKGKNPDFWLMGEIIHGDYNRWANPQALDSVTNYECWKGIYSSHNDHNYFEIAHSLNRQSGAGGIYRGLCLYNFVDNHDVDRVASLLREPENLFNVYTLLYTMPGIPSVYYGSEWGIRGKKEKNSDAPLRPCLELSDIPQGCPGLLPHLQKLGMIRRMLPALQYGEYASALIKNEQFVFSRRTSEHAAYIALNQASNPQYIEFRAQEHCLVDCLSGTRFESNDGNFKLELPARGARLLLPEADAARVQEGLAAAGKDTFAQPEPVAQPAQDTAKADVNATEPVAPGRYRHFKGGEYEVIGTARHSETQERLVVYRALYGDGGLWVRPEKMFTEMVERDGKTFPRFTKIG